ncbi:hypothetical protein EYC80_006266 [Monilinia laxa]|uniref:Uncharacterized protein n=1 Tax=Monilinia laxa TaxID=61186 RepID=A0A5N6KH90_MONLA|nr:hypothetical protein EYC80_006266 [Monilinia laxa]
MDADIWKIIVFSDHLLSLFLTIHPSNHHHYKSTNPAHTLKTIHTKKYKIKCGEKNLLSLDILKPISGEYTTKRMENPNQSIDPYQIPSPYMHHHEGFQNEEHIMSSSVVMLKVEA